MIEVNFNDRVRVQLTPEGAERYANFFRELNLEPIRLLKDNYLETELWSLFQIFGPNLSMTAPVVFVKNRMTFLYNNVHTKGLQIVKCLARCETYSEVKTLQEEAKKLVANMPVRVSVEGGKHVFEVIEGRVYYEKEGRPSLWDDNSPELLALVSELASLKERTR